MQIDPRDIPAGVHTTVLAGHMPPDGSPLSYTIVWADRTYDECPCCHQPVDSVPDCPVILNVDVGWDALVEELEQRHGCGLWLSVSWRQLGGCEPATEQQVLAAAAELAAERTHEIAENRAQRAGELREELRAALQRLREPLDDGETEEDRIDEICTGSETEPGIDYDPYGADEWAAWDYDPSGEGEAIVVTEQDLEHNASD